MDPHVVDVTSRPTDSRLERPQPLPLTDAIAGVTRFGLGAIGMVVSTLAQASSGAVKGNGSHVAPVPVAPRPGGLLRLVPGALLGAGFEAERRLLQASAAVEIRVIHVSSAVSRRMPGAPRSAVERSLVRWNQRGRAEQARNEILMGELVRRLAPELAEAMVERLPVEEILNRLDMATLTRRILENIDLAGIVRESTATVGSDVVDAARTQAMGADSMVERMVDRVMRRRAPRDLGMAES